MKRLIIAISAMTFVISALAQTNTAQSTTNAGELEALKIQLQAQIGSELDNLSPGVQAKLQDAKQAVETARNQYKHMSQTAADAAKKQARENADDALGEAIRTMEQVSAQLKVEIEKAKCELQNQLHVRIEEAKKLQSQIRAHDGSGTGPSPK